MAFGRGKSRDGDVARNTYTWPNEYKGENIMYRLPTNIYYNDNIIVMEDEYAVFMRDGKAMHVFDQAGRYALTTQNVPILRTILPAITGIKQLGEVYYIQRREMRGKFGTPEPLTFRDADFGLVRLRVFGQFSYKVVDPLLFITQFVGTRGWSGSEEVVEWLRSELIQSVNDTMGELKRDKNMALVDMPAYINEIEQLVLGKIDGEAKRYGLDIINLAGITITPPKEVQDAIDRRGAMGALGVNYMEYQTGKAIEGVGEGAAKGGNGAAALAGLGAGAGIGLGMGGAMGQGMQQGSSGPKEVMVKCRECGALVAQDAKFCKECGKTMVKEEKTIKCPKCGDLNSPDQKFCDECGASMKAKCPKCGVELASDAKFCKECGEKITG
ncbi:MAG: SPFH domain-containing protein [Candidatus Thermoplasmatota archaeon]|nr:SPFH domain-containing protein [Euryarchaeota archaeon]MBU4032358.1 SPFH domain-containing protein [Candidatus Thermoplasmatota archaeon]MBU4071869.1 SPFH domain-containing protein [Candidatus Thermoplasmatota archaeon]MBU4144012.1 SPFH domain-containing protein [Candidatus Thermoplasmatota archaeon]MBU4591874.1 SPFH domain-containing protein [Candidatus Thermoplasmatota archaeon]